MVGQHRLLSKMIFRDRIDAAKQLAQKLQHLKGQDGVVLAIPKGGVVFFFF